MGFSGLMGLLPSHGYCELRSLFPLKGMKARVEARDSSVWEKRRDVGRLAIDLGDQAHQDVGDEKRRMLRMVPRFLTCITEWSRHEQTASCRPNPSLCLRL